MPLWLNVEPQDERNTKKPPRTPVLGGSLYHGPLVKPGGHQKTRTIKRTTSNRVTNPAPRYMRITPLRIVGGASDGDRTRFLPLDRRVPLHSASDALVPSPGVEPRPFRTRLSTWRVCLFHQPGNGGSSRNRTRTGLAPLTVFKTGTPANRACFRGELSENRTPVCGFTDRRLNLSANNSVLPGQPPRPSAALDTQARVKPGSVPSPGVEPGSRPSQGQDSIRERGCGSPSRNRTYKCRGVTDRRLYRSATGE